MAVKGGNRQQRLAAKAVRRKQSVAAKQKAERFASSPAGRIAAAAARPIDRCLRLGELVEAGIGHVILARRLPSGALGCGFFLVDLFCLGVKDVFYRELSPSEIDKRMAEMASRGHGMVSIHPASAKKLILGAVAFAARYGMAPAKDYRTVIRLFDGIDAEAATESFTFGQDGMPLFIPGPNDTPARMREIQRALERSPGIVDANSNLEANMEVIRRFASILRGAADLAATDEDDLGPFIEYENVTEPSLPPDDA